MVNIYKILHSDSLQRLSPSTSGSDINRRFSVYLAQKGGVSRRAVMFVAFVAPQFVLSLGLNRPNTHLNSGLVIL